MQEKNQGIGDPKRPKEDRISGDVGSPQMQVGMDLAKWRSLGNLVEAISTKKLEGWSVWDCRLLQRRDKRRKWGIHPSDHSNEALYFLLKELKAVSVIFQRTVSSSWSSQ